MFIPQLISKNEVNSESTVICISQIASQCSDTDSILTAVSFLFDVLKGISIFELITIPTSSLIGSEGKLTLPKQKSSVLSCIRSFADAPTGSGKNIVGLSSSVASIFIKHLQQVINKPISCFLNFKSVQFFRRLTKALWLLHIQFCHHGSLTFVLLSQVTWLIGLLKHLLLSLTTQQSGSPTCLSWLKLSSPTLYIKFVSSSFFPHLFYLSTFRLKR